MNTIDIIIVVLLVIGAYSGYKKGFVMEIASLLAFFVAIIAGMKLLDWGIDLLSEYISGFDHLLPILAFAVIFVAVLILINFLGKMVKQVLDMTLLGNLDDVAGAAIGILKSGLFLSILIWIYESFAGDFGSNLTGESFLYEPISNIAPGIFRLFSGLYPSLMDLFDSGKEYINNDQVTV